MTTLSKMQVELIRGDIRQNGVELIDLEEDLLDHICCAIEQEMDGEKSFEELYQMSKDQVVPNGYREIQEATNQLITLKYNNMKKTMNITGIVGSALFLLGSIFKTLHLPFGGSEILLLGALALVLGYLPMVLILSLQQTDLLVGKIRNMSGYLGASAIVLGVCFQVLHLSGGKMIFLIGTVLFLIIFIPLFIKSVGKDAVLKIQPASVSVILIAIVCALFAFNNKRPSTKSMRSLLEVNETIEQSYSLKKSRIQALEVNESEALIQSAQATDEFLSKLKVYIVKSVDDRSTSGKMDFSNVTLMNSASSWVLTSDNCPSDLNVTILQNHIEKFLAELQKRNVKTNTILTKTNNGLTWVETHFKGKSMYGVYTTLNSFQLELAQLELEALNKVTLPTTPS